MRYRVVDYKEPIYFTPKINLEFQLGLNKTIVSGKYYVVINNSIKNYDKYDIELNGHSDVKLCFIGVNNKKLQEGVDFNIIHDGDYSLLIIPNKFGEQFELNIQVKINPELNLSYEGLYVSDGGLVSQNESQGFRRIIYSIDRPDNLGVYTTTIIGNKNSFPVMLSNGNEVKFEKKLPSNMHGKVYHDPFPKPSYLFAICCGDYNRASISYETHKSRYLKRLELYSPKFEAKENVTFAIDVLHKMMLWNEKVYDLELDLDEYKIVGATKFNSGAMENKGLNVFSSSDVFLNPEYSTDYNYKRVLTVVSHEVAHNWAGNRVTVRDWSQLCLKEGLATHIEQQFSQDILDSPVVRLENIQLLRDRQFAEDASYLAHPVHPKEYDSIDNFYTLTIYEKGAELLQTLEELLGKNEFIKGVKKYFEKYDSYRDIGSDYFKIGATVNNFIETVAESCNTNLKLFMNWYDYAGTPELSFSESYNNQTNQYCLTIEQHAPRILNKDKNKNLEPIFLIPIKLSLFDTSGKKLPLKLLGAAEGHSNLSKPYDEIILTLDKNKKTFIFDNVNCKPIPSLLRNFSAPVKIRKDPLDIAGNHLLIENDDDAFVKYDRMQSLFKKEIISIYNKKSSKISDEFISLYIKILKNKKIPNDLKAMMIDVPSYSSIAQGVDFLDPIVVHDLIKSSKAQLAIVAHDLLKNIRDNLINDANIDNLFDIHNTQPVKDRMLLLKSQDLLCYSGNKCDIEFALNTAYSKDNFTLIYNSYMSYLISQEDHIKIIDNNIIQEMYKIAINDINLRQKWLSLQASIGSSDCINNIEKLISGEIKGFDISHPHQSYSLIRHFILNNKYFHDSSGRGYKVIADALYKLDTEIKNYNISSRLAASYLPAKNLDNKYKDLLLVQINQLKNKPKISDSLSEILNSIYSH